MTIYKSKKESENSEEKLASFDEMIDDLKKITNLTEDEIVDFVRSNSISYSELSDFFHNYRRLPNNPQDYRVIEYYRNDAIRYDPKKEQRDKEFKAELSRQKIAFKADKHLDVLYEEVDNLEKLEKPSPIQLKLIGTKKASIQTYITKNYPLL